MLIKLKIDKASLEVIKTHRRHALKLMMGGLVMGGFLVFAKNESQKETHLGVSVSQLSLKFKNPLKTPNTMLIFARFAMREESLFCFLRILGIFFFFNF